MRTDDGKRALSLVGLTLLLFAAVRGPASAISFHFAPANISVQARPGELVNRTITLTLAKDCQQTHFKTKVEDWWRSADNERTFYAKPGTLARSCAPWCSLDPVESPLKPDETLNIKVSIRVPDDAKPGGYWAALTIDEVLDPTQPRPQGVAMVFRASLSVGIYVEIPDANRSAKITGVKVSKDRLSVTMMNDGNIPLRINGSFEFFKPGTAVPVATTRIGGEPLLPEPINTCTFTTVLPDKEKLPPGRYRIRVIMDAGLDHLLGAEKEMDIIRQDSQ